jgi:HEAT repeat protein
LKKEEADLREFEVGKVQPSEQPFQIQAVADETPATELSWVDVGISIEPDVVDVLPVEDEAVSAMEPSFVGSQDEKSAKAIDVLFAEKGIAAAEDDTGIPTEILKRLSSPDAGERQAALRQVAQVGGDDAFRCITRAFDDQSADVRNAAARALYDMQPDRAATFTRALREGSSDRRRKIGQALAASGLASASVGNLTGESREKTYDAFSLLFLMAKAGEVQPLMQAIEDYPNVEVRIAVVKVLALSGQPEIVPAFRRLAVRGSLPSEVRSAVMEAIYQISTQARESAPSAA